MPHSSNLYGAYTQTSMRILLILLCLHAPWSFGRELVFGYIDFPPLFYLGENGVPEGKIIDLLHDIEREKPYEFVMIRYPNKHLYRALAKGRVDVYASVKLSELERIGDFSKHVLNNLDVVILSNKPITGQVKNLTGRLGVLRGYEYGNLLQTVQKNNPQLTLITRNNHTSLITSLRDGNIDYAMNYLSPALIASKKIGFDNMLHQTISSIPVYFFVSKKLFNRHQVLADIDNFINNLPAGSYGTSP